MAQHAATMQPGSEQGVTEGAVDDAAMTRITPSRLPRMGQQTQRRLQWAPSRCQLLRDGCYGAVPSVME